MYKRWINGFAWVFVFIGCNKTFVLKKVNGIWEKYKILNMFLVSPKAKEFIYPKD